MPPGASKGGGVMIIALVVVGVAIPSITNTTLIGAILIAIAALGNPDVVSRLATASFEAITAEEFQLAGSPLPHG
jgi:hypothetical protein